MAHHHHHGHHHDHDHDHDHDAPIVDEQPLDTANQSLSDALRISFRVLKGIMMILLVVYLFSNVRSIGSSEQAMVVRIGELQAETYGPGLVWAFPFPVDELLRLPTRKSNEVLINSHTFFRREDEIGKPLSFISRGHGGLNPSIDGALITADSGLVHVQWKVNYRIDEVRSFVREFAGDQVSAAEVLLRTMIERVGIEVAGELNAEEVIRTRVDHVQSEMRSRVNARLAALHSGVSVVQVEMNEPTPPIEVRDSFDNTQKSENEKQRQIRLAEQERTRILSEAAGATYSRLLDLQDQMDTATAEDDRERLRRDLDRMLMEEVEGKAGQLIKDAGAYHSKVVNRIQSDVERYRTLLPEYERNPSLLIARLWEQTRDRIVSSTGVTKFYWPSGGKELRLNIPLDPEQTRMDEEIRLQEKTFDPKKLRKQHYEPVGVFED
jgi:regulator of protease activity HflC (stomatin/prohibitin superfamily)